MREFSLGNETLQCFVDRETLYKVHECVFAVRALESEPVGLRL
jgi:protein phosphatase